MAAYEDAEDRSLWSECGTYKTVTVTYKTITAMYKTVTAIYKTVTATYKTVTGADAGARADGRVRGCRGPLAVERMWHI